MLLLEVREQAGNRLGQSGQLPQQAHRDTRPRGHRNPPPFPAEPARIRNGVPAAAEPDHSHEHEAGEGAEDPEHERVRDKDPEFARLGERR